MERMGDILARTAIRRAQLTRAADSTAPQADAVSPTAPGAPTRVSRATHPPRAGQPGTADRVGRSGSLPARAMPTRPLGRGVPQRSDGSRAGTLGGASGPLARPDLLEMPPGLPGATGPTGARPDLLIDDRILEIPPRRTSYGVGAGTPVNRLPDSSGRFPQSSPHSAESRSIPPEQASRTDATRAANGADRLSGAARPAASAGQPAARVHEAGGSYASGEPSACPICGGAGYVRLDAPVGDPAFGRPVPCACKERQIEERRRSDLRRLSSLDPFLDKTFDTFDPAVQGVREAYDVARNFAADPDGWLVLSGPHGVGKTHLAAAIANQQLAQGNSVFFSIVPDLLDHLRATFAPSSEVPYDEMFDKVREAGLLVLDDLGAENSTAWATEKLFQLINYRYNFHMPTVVTTNARLLTHMDDRIRSRLSDISLVRHSVIKAQDYRERHIDRSRRPGGTGGPSGSGRSYSQRR
jgi:DNA replication protein DnaC